MLPQAAITAGIQTWWQNHFPLETTTLYPGQKTNTENLDEWLELWIEAWAQQTRRTAQPHAIQINITLHLFVKATNNLARIHTLAEAARATLEHQHIPLHDPTQSGHPYLGYANLQEARVQELTRPLQSTTPNLQHQVLTIQGRAEPI